LQDLSKQVSSASAIPPSSRALMAPRESQEAVAPSKRRAARHVQSLSRLGDTQTFKQRLSLTKPPVPVAQSRQRRARQCVERLAAVTTLVSLQTPGLPVAHDVQVLAMRAHRQDPRAIPDDSPGCLSSLRGPQPIDQVAALDPCQRLDRQHQPLQFPFAHRTPQTVQYGTAPCSQFDNGVAHHVSLSLLNANRAHKNMS